MKLFLFAMIWTICSIAAVAVWAEGETAYQFCDRDTEGRIVIHVAPGSTKEQIKKAGEQCKTTLNLLDALKMPTLQSTGAFPWMLGNTPEVLGE